MALPLEFYETFEAGTKGNFDTENDLSSRLDYPHARDLALYGMIPYRGAYCLRLNLGRDILDAYLERAVSWASGQTRYGRFRFYVGSDVQFGNNLDNVRLVQFYSGTAPSEVAETSIRLGRIDPIGIVLAFVEESETWSDGVASSIKVPFGSWITVEFVQYVDATYGGIVGRTLDACLQSFYAPQGTNTILRVGAITQTGDIQGTILIDDFAIDEDRLFTDFSPQNGALSGGSMLFLQSGFAFVGPGVVEHISLADGGSADCVLSVYDTDNPNSLPLGSLREKLVCKTASIVEQTKHLGFRCNTGCYVALSGTNPQAIVRLGPVQNEGVL